MLYGQQVKVCTYILVLVAAFFAIFLLMYVNAHVKHSAHVCALWIGLRKAAESRTRIHPGRVDSA